MYSRRYDHNEYNSIDSDIYIIPFRIDCRSWSTNQLTATNLIISHLNILHIFCMRDIDKNVLLNGKYSWFLFIQFTIICVIVLNSALLQIYLSH